MKYTVFGFSQQAAVDLNLDMVDLAVLRWIVDFYPRMSKRVIEGETYAWVNYQALLRDMPTMPIKKRMLINRLNHMVSVGILKHKTVRQGGVYAYYAFGLSYSLLITSSPEPEPDPQKAAEDDTKCNDCTGVVQPLHKGSATIALQINSSINDSSTNIERGERVASAASPSPASTGGKKRPNPDGYQIARVLAEVTHIDFDKNRARLMAEAKYYTLADIPILRTAYGPQGIWYRADWRGKRGELPNLASIRQTWGTLGLDGKGIGGPNRRGIEVS